MTRKKKGSETEVSAGQIPVKPKRTTRPPPPPKGNKRAVGNKGGQPTLYRPEYCISIIEFFSIEESPFREVSTKTGIQLIPRRMPTFERFAAKIGVDDATLWRWANEKNDDGEYVNPEFCNAYSRAKSMQKAFLIEGGVAGALNSSFTGLLMKSVYEWKDKVEQDVSHSGRIDFAAIDAELEEEAEEFRKKMRDMDDEKLVEKFSN